MKLTRLEFLVYLFIKKEEEAKKFLKELKDLC